MDPAREEEGQYGEKRAAEERPEGKAGEQQEQKSLHGTDHRPDEGKKTDPVSHVFFIPFGPWHRDP